ncbi:MAG: RNA methyltransferase [Lachnospiraceae bacterium]|nr:RNA methyltransferase [Lachnospiraceae bacterium]
MELSFKEIKNLQKYKKARDEQGLFVTEGRKLFLEAPKEDLVEVLATRAYAKEYGEDFKKLPPDVRLLDGLDEGRFMSLADTKSPQGILTVLRKPSFSMEMVFQEADPLFLLLENLQDPGNAGTIVRTGEAAGVTAVFLTAGSADMTSPKTVRSTMGSVFRVPHFYVEDTDRLLESFRLRGVRTYAAHLLGKRSYAEEDYRGGAAFFIGNEGRGLTDALALKADVRVRIPMKGRVESLNAAMAAGILLYEAGRQRAGGFSAGR